MIMPTIKFHQDLRVYQKSFDTAMEIYQLSKIFPAEERYSLTDQIRRSSRSVSANISEALGKRKYEKSLFQNLQTPKARQEKLRPGFNLQEVVSILMKNNLKFKQSIQPNNRDGSEYDESVTNLVYIFINK